MGFRVAFVAVLSLAAGGAIAQTPEPTWSLVVGYAQVDLGAYSHSHDTHPDDSFLPNANVPGSAGETRFGGPLHMGLVGLRYTLPVVSIIDSRSDGATLDADSTWRELTKRLSFSLEGAGLLGFVRDSRDNANDTRPDPSRIWSEAWFGFRLNAGADCRTGRFSFGGVGQITVVEVQSGWNRFDRDERSDRDIVYIFTGGPRASYFLDEKSALEASVQFGETMTFNVNYVWTW